MLFKKRKSEKLILEQIYSKTRLIRYSQFIIGLLLVSVAFNAFILPNDIVYGVSGIGVILNKTLNISPSLVILIGGIALLILSFIVLGKEKTKNSIVGSLLYPVFVELTSWIVKYIDLGSTETVVVVLFGAVISGVGFGLIFKSGFTTGGTDILNQIVSEKAKVSIGKSMIFTDGVIIVSSLFVFGWQKFIYSIINMYIISVMTDKVILGISSSKTFYIITEREDEVKKFILDYLSHGITVLEARGGYTNSKQKVIMCTIPTKEYFKAKEGIHAIDKEAFFIVTDAYEVYGGA
jgi:uncharacterized membrane-anchored protein YitT (DUF2179 family)